MITKTSLKALLAITLFLGFGIQARAAEKPDYNPDLLIFAGELRLYVEKAKELSSAPDSAKTEKDKITVELQETGKRLSRVYFSETAEVIQNELNKHLSTTLKENAALKNYFLHLGNAFAAQAVKLVASYKNQQKKIRIYSIAGGAAVGLLVGGGYLFFKAKSAASSITTAALSGKDYGLAAAAVVGGTAIGFGVGTVYANKLPMDSAIKNANDFEAKYPHGQDFIDKLDESRDLAFLQSALKSN